MGTHAINASSPTLTGQPEMLSPDPVMATVYGCITVVGIIANLANVPFFLQRYNTVRQLDSFYFFGLLLADLGYACLCQTLSTAVVALGRWPFGVLFCSVYDYFRLVLENAGVWMMVVISSDKLLLLTCDYSRYLRSKRRVRMAIHISLTFLLPAAFHLGGLLLWLFTTTSEQRAEDYWDCQDIPADIDTPFVLISATTNMFLPGLALAIINVLVFVKITRRMKRRRQLGNGFVMQRVPEGEASVVSSRHVWQEHKSVSEVQPESETLPFPRNPVPEPGESKEASQAVPVPPRGTVKGRLDTEYRRYVRPAITLAGLVFIFCICWLPFAFYYVYTHVFCASCFNIKTQLWLRCLLFANSALHPFAYAATNRKLREFHAKRFRIITTLCSPCSR